MADDSGSTAIEYALVASLIMLVILGAVTLFASNAVDMWDDIATHI